MVSLSHPMMIFRMTFHYFIPLLLFPGFITGGYVSNPNSAGGYSTTNNGGAIVGGYPYPTINNNNNGGGYSSSSSGSGGYPASTGGYGPPCCENKYPFLPAPPGQTPPCSKQGSTFCEKLETYPTETIRYLLYKWGATYSQFIKTELNEDFIMMTQNYSYFYPKPEYGSNLYGSYGAPSNHYSYNTHYNNSYQPQKQQQSNANLYNHQQQQPQLQQQQPQLQQQQPNSNFYNNNQPQQQQQQYPVLSHEQAAAMIIPPLLHSIWWSHRDTATHRPSFPYVAQHRLNRVKRQTTGDNQLCRLSSRFIVPQAAMNNQGNWMYVVNMDDTRFVQQVRTEECAEGDGSNCDGLCSIPPGYRSSCRQKYVQKRLVALDGSGQNLRGEVFWFPHCCVCEVTRG